MQITNQEKLECAERELKQRRYVYPRRVEAGKMSKPFADRQIEVMAQIVADYRQIAQSERLI